MIYNQVGMEEILYDYHTPVIKADCKEPTPQIDKNVKIMRGYYVRVKNGDVMRVDELGKERVKKYYIDCKRRDGSFYKKPSYEKTPTYISNIFLDGREVSEYFVPEDVYECHRTIIECIYKGDRIIDRKNRYLTVKSKVIRKSVTYLICEYDNGEIRLNNHDIIEKCMADRIKVKNLSVGDKVQCKYRGLVTVYKIWSRKIQAYTLSKDSLFFVNEGDILEVVDQ